MNRLLLAALWAIPTVAAANTLYLQIDVTQDGEDILTFQGNTLRWQHISDFANSSANISATINGVAVLASALPK